MNYRDFSTGALDNEGYRLYAYSFTLNGAKTVRSVTLPQNRKVVVLARTARVVPKSSSNFFNGAHQKF